MNLLQAEHLFKRLGTFQLNDISFALPAGYICGLVGQNGAGKTTLLHLVLGLYRLDKGNILVNGMDYNTEEKQIHNMIGTVLMEDLFIPSMTLIQNGDWYGKYYAHYNHECMEHYLSLFHLDKRKKFGRLSKGEKLKCQFAFALSHDARLLILDEPTGNFDPDFREQFFQVIKDFIQDGTRSVLLATHITQDLDRMADYIIYLENGNQIFAGDIEELHQRYRMVSGEKYKIQLLPKEKLIYLEENQYGAKALVAHSQFNCYDGSLQVSYPTIEELMYFQAKWKTGRTHL
ncbi:MAG: ABC transporter ATP-binding protein [Lachnospiraceae bacterium]|nr:ABC transporter ATP-binding protein [Lachnospiraceae bacterium]